MSFLRDTLCGPCASHPKRAITYLWFLSMVLVFAAFIAGCVAAARIDSNGQPKALGFAVIWTVLSAFSLSIGGTAIMRTTPSAYNVGLLLGLVSMMSMLCLVVGAIFAGRSEVSGDSDQSPDIAVSVFACFLFLVYAVFSLILFAFRDDIIAKTPSGAPVSTGGKRGLAAQMETEHTVAEANGLPPMSI